MADALSSGRRGPAPQPAGIAARAVDLASIERELAASFVGGGGGEGADEMVTRACMSNLLVLSVPPRDRAGLVARALADLGRDPAQRQAFKVVRAMGEGLMP